MFISFSEILVTRDVIDCINRKNIFKILGKQLLSPSCCKTAKMEAPAAIRCSRPPSVLKEGSQVFETPYRENCTAQR